MIEDRLKDALINTEPPNGAAEPRFIWQCGFDIAKERALLAARVIQREVENDLKRFGIELEHLKHENTELVKKIT